MFVLPDNLRDSLKEPIGLLVNEQELLETLAHETYIISVGDMVTYTLLNNQIHPTICIVDYFLKRKQYSPEMKKKIKDFDATEIQVHNPAGTITDELWNTIEKVYEKRNNDRFRIEVDGEEDLASLAAIYLAPSDATIIYGLPNKGVVIVKATPAHKDKVKQILDKM
jgi:uncharacterized protein (UPF0218 family)